MSDGSLGRPSRPSQAGDRRRRPENRRVTPPPPRVPLSVRMRGFFARQQSRLVWVRRIAAWTIQLGLVALALTALMAGGRIVLRYLQSAPAFATTAIEIKGSTQLSAREIERIAGLAIGKNVFEVSAEEATAKLQAEPWIESASVQRRLPGTYRIQLKERRALALLAAGELYLVAEDGTAFKPLTAGDPGDLPLITGIELASIEHDRHAAAAVLLQAVALLREYGEAGLMRREPISEIHVEADNSLSAYIGADATHVRMGKAPFRTKLRRLREVFGQLASQNTRAHYVYLDNERRPDRVTVKLR